MSKDYRMEFIRSVEASLVSTFSQEQIMLISNMIVKELDMYEITERCTDVIPVEDINENIAKKYFACLMIDGKSKNTIYQYIRTIRKLSNAIQKPYPEMVTYDIRLFLALEQHRGISGRTLENTRANISAFFQWMVNDEIIQKNPTSNIKPIKYHQEVRKPFSEVEIDALRSGCRTVKERAIIEMLLSTGVRVSELSYMNVEDVNINKLSVHVTHGKGSKERVTYTTSVAMKHLLRYIEERREDGEALFYNKDHKRLNDGGIRHILNTISKRSGVYNVHPHRFRRTFATNLAKRGMDVQEIQRLLGHSNINTTMTYVCIDDSKIQESYNRYIA